MKRYANCNYISSFGYILCLLYLRSRHDTTLTSNLHEFNEEVSLFRRIPFQLEINCKFAETLKVNEKNTDVNERTISLDCVEIWLIIKTR